jgi:hypothetical protein
MSWAQAHPCCRGACEARPSVTLSHASPQPARRLRRVLAEQRGLALGPTEWPDLVVDRYGGTECGLRSAR